MTRTYATVVDMRKGTECSDWIDRNKLNDVVIYVDFLPDGRQLVRATVNR